MGFVEAVKTVLVEKYACFTGRATRSEYWYFCLFNFIVGVVIGGVLGSLGNAGVYIYYAYMLAVLIPGIAVFVRRMHDIGKSGWYYFWVLVPIVGVIYLLILLCKESGPDNQYGPAPQA